ncbi:uncharacterized protein [Mycetomoellerius zeteki]|uniref:uncharacterized protein n=1 Tax=Mycetomoellerius zeteki TaxID=64791 RepID=UPI00084E9F34|nr:PREDICTED: uncharacterized protein LOC108730071 [Trachymyrmex zeteki]
MEMARSGILPYEKFKRVFKELFLIREIIKESSEDVKVTFVQTANADKRDEDNSTFFTTFHFPLQSIEELDEMEHYLEQSNCFQSTVKELFKMGGARDPLSESGHLKSAIIHRNCAREKNHATSL